MLKSIIWDGAQLFFSLPLTPSHRLVWKMRLDHYLISFYEFYNFGLHTHTNTHTAVASPAHHLSMCPPSHIRTNTSPYPLLMLRNCALFCGPQLLYYFTLPCDWVDGCLSRIKDCQTTTKTFKAFCDLMKNLKLDLNVWGKGRFSPISYYSFCHCIMSTINQVLHFLLTTIFANILFSSRPSWTGQVSLTVLCLNSKLYESFLI